MNNSDNNVVKFDLNLVVHQKTQLRAILDWLFERELFTYEVRYANLDNKDVYLVDVEGCWGANLEEIGKIIHSVEPNYDDEDDDEIEDDKNNGVIEITGTPIPEPSIFDKFHFTSLEYVKFDPPTEQLLEKAWTTNVIGSDSANITFSDHNPWHVIQCKEAPPYAGFLPCTREKGHEGPHACPDDPTFISVYCRGEKCKCGKPASAKVEEVIFDDDPIPCRHPMVQYLCRQCFNNLMGPDQALGHPV